MVLTALSVHQTIACDHYFANRKVNRLQDFVSRLYLGTTICKSYTAVTNTFALGSSLTTALHNICLARSAYLKIMNDKNKCFRAMKMCTPNENNRQRLYFTQAFIFPEKLTEDANGEM